ncbi:SGNH/GDSL hydrolase family protein [Ideonella sp. A 288]|uniref:SGNH/GDSL hydrolase family protein n=1 Tax=Ideonella sp. A 288 TaxID=1962181 RepID=UPI001303464B|nr:SGNH/GDSL hydrolase family protein [Ideonella sp. A 288]
MFTSVQRRLLTLVIGVAGLIGNSQAAYTGLVFFGDSLVDTGNVAALTGGAFPSNQGAPGRFSNGPVWTEHLAAGLGMPDAAKNSNLVFDGTSVVPIGIPGGTNYAFGGARTGFGGLGGPTTGLMSQLIAWNGSVFGSGADRVADPNALYVVMAGGNDLRDYRNGLPAALTPLETAANVVAAVGRLALSGAQHFLLSSLPDLGKTPEAGMLGKTAESTAATLAFNAALAALSADFDAQYQALTGVDLDIHWMDLFGLNEAVVDDALNNGGARFGITNVSSPCLGAGPVSGEYFAPDASASGCDVSAYSDPLHPSAVSHQLIGQLALATVPEPGSIALALCALMALGIARRRAA